MNGIGSTVGTILGHGHLATIACQTGLQLIHRACCRPRDPPVATLVPRGASVPARALGTGGASPMPEHAADGRVGSRDLHELGEGRIGLDLLFFDLSRHDDLVVAAMRARHH